MFYSIGIFLSSLIVYLAINTVRWKLSKQSAVKISVGQCVSLDVNRLVIPDHKFTILPTRTCITETRDSELYFLFCCFFFRLRMSCLI